MAIIVSSELGRGNRWGAHEIKPQAFPHARSRADGFERLESSRPMLIRDAQIRLTAFALDDLLADVREPRRQVGVEGVDLAGEAAQLSLDRGPLLGDILRAGAVALD